MSDSSHNWGLIESIYYVFHCGFSLWVNIVNECDVTAGKSIHSRTLRFMFIHDSYNKFSIVYSFSIDLLFCCWVYEQHKCKGNTKGI